MSNAYQNRDLRGYWLAAGLVLGAWACSERAELGERAQTGIRGDEASSVASRPAPHLRLALITDLEGALEPCGCSSRPAGGVDRLAYALAALKREQIPTLVLAAGQLFANVSSVAATTRPRAQDLWKAQALSAVLNRLNLDVIAPGPSDFMNALPQLQALARARKHPLLAQRLSAELEAVRASIICEVGNTQVGVASAPSGEEVARLRKAGAKLVIAISHGAEQAQDAGRSGADIIVHSGLQTSVDGDPTTHAALTEHALVLGGERHGEQLTVVDLWLSQASPQRFRLLDKPPDHVLPSQALALAHARALDRSAPRDPAIRALLDKLFARINAHNASMPHASAEPPALRAGQAAYVGSRTCAACHTQAYFWWRETPHGRAFDTLIARGRELDLDCIGCHVTGYEQAGGVSLSALDELKGVGCESCHGPGGQHVENPSQPRNNVRRGVESQTCTACHDNEHSDRFAYAPARARLLVVGHGAGATK